MELSLHESYHLQLAEVWYKTLAKN
eukprot:COSAG05_NODE_20503_length_279_cov_0.544444_1_plen_24_part_10